MTIPTGWRAACAVIVGLGGLGFVFWLAQHEQDSVTIPPIRAVLVGFLVI
jgi:hypothetical protein